MLEMEKFQEEDSVPFLRRDDDDDDDGHNTNSTEEAHLAGLSQNKKKPPLSRTWWLFGAFVAVLVATNIASLFVGSRLWRADLDRICASHTSEHQNAVLRDVKVTYTSTLLNGSFYKETIYRRPPSPEVDAAWLALGIQYDPLIVPDADAEMAGIEQNRFHVNESYGGPGYPAFVAGLHQLHCLNLLRKGLYFNVDYYKALNQDEFDGPEDKLQSHIGHCLDIIRQRLMCTADTEVNPYIWVGSPPHITPDFNRMYKCRNYDEIREYARQRQAPWGPNGPDVVPEEGSLVLEAVP